MTHSKVRAAVRAVTTVAGCAALFVDHVALAQESSSKGLEEVIVTARKTTESAQDVPISLTALSSEAMQAKAVLNVQDLALVVPGLLVSTNSQGGAPTFAIRAARSDNGTSDTVTAYIDDVPVASTRSIANMVYDMQSISTLKGPQGTLFGANSTGGAIIFRPNKPTNDFEGYAQLGYGNWNRIEVEGMVNVPLGDTFAVRLAGNLVQRDGYVKNRTPVNGNSELTEEDRYSLRLGTRWTPSDRFQNDLTFEYYNEDGQGFQETLVALRDRYDYTTFLGGLVLPIDYAAAGVTLDGIDREHAAVGPQPTFNKAEILNVIEAATFDVTSDVSAKLVVGWQDLDLDTAQDNDSTPLTVVNGRTRFEITQLTVEPSIDSTWHDGKLRNKTGLFYSKRETDTGNSYGVLGFPFDLTAFGGPNGPLGSVVSSFYPLQSNSTYTREMETQAIYSQFSYDLSDTLTATVGVRYTRDKGDYSARAFLAFGAAGVADTWGSFTEGGCNSGALEEYDNFDPNRCIAFADLESSRTSFNISLENKVSDNMLVYAASRGGYIAGGFNNQANPAQTGMPIVFEPESVVDFEMGIKSDWELAGRPIRTNLAGFYGSYKNQQRVQNGQTPEGNTFIGVVNAGASNYYGLDFEATYEFSDMFSALIGWNLVKSEYTDFDAILNIPGQFAYIDLKGEPMSQTPENVVTAALTADWVEDSSIGSISSTLSAFYRDSTAAKDSPTVAGTLAPDGELIAVDPSLDFRRWDQLESFTVLNFTTQWNNILGSSIDANVWVKNLTDEKYNIASSNQMLSNGYATYWYGTPREYGLSLRYKF